MIKIICHSSLSKKYPTKIRPANESFPSQKKITINDVSKLERRINKIKHGILQEKDRETVFYITQDNEDFEVHSSYILCAEIRNSELYKEENGIGLDAGNTFLLIKKSIIERL